MINKVYQLVSPRIISEKFEEINNISEKVAIRPEYMSICQADQRYYQGNRSDNVLNEKLPMALIHESVGKVINDPTNTFNVGDYVIMIPNTPVEENNIIAENYLRSSKFRSSGYDGFMSDYVFMNPDRLVKIEKNANLKVASFTELISVSYHAIDRFKKFAYTDKKRIGVWGDGNLGYITSLLLKTIFPESEIIIFGKNEEKLMLFSFADEKYLIYDLPEDLSIDHAFECVGGVKSRDAIKQIIDIINPEGTISLLGVSEYDIPINTRMVLEKGLNIFGSSRSGKEDFKNTIKLIEENPNIINYLENLINETIEIKSVKDIQIAFEKDKYSNFGKTILKWNI